MISSIVPCLQVVTLAIIKHKKFCCVGALVKLSATLKSLCAKGSHLTGNLISNIGFICISALVISFHIDIFNICLSQEHMNI